MWRHRQNSLHQLSDAELVLYNSYCQYFTQISTKNLSQCDRLAYMHVFPLNIYYIFISVVNNIHFILNRNTNKNNNNNNNNNYTAFSNLQFNFGIICVKLIMIQALTVWMHHAR